MKSEEKVRQELNVGKTIIKPTDYQRGYIEALEWVLE